MSVRVLQMPTAKGPVQVYDLSIDLTNQEIWELVSDLTGQVWGSQQGIFLTVSGYNDDPRELWEIPEVIEFYKRLIDIGFMSVMEVSSSIEGLATYIVKATGAIELWLIVKGLITQPDIGQETVDQFFEDLFKSNARVDQRRSGIIPEGQSRYER